MTTSQASEIPERLLRPQGQADRRDRNRMLYRLRTQSALTWPRLSEMFALTERQCQNVVRGFREAEAAAALDEHEAREAVRDVLDGLDDTLERLTIVASRPTTAPSVVVSALTGRLNAYGKKIELLQALGLVSLGQVRLEIDLEVTARRILEVLARHGIDEQVRREIIEAVDRPVEGTAVEITAGGDDVGG